MTAPTIDVFIDGLNLDGAFPAMVTDIVTPARTFDELVSTLTTDGKTPVADDKPRPCTNYPTAGITPADIVAFVDTQSQRRVVLLVSSVADHDTAAAVMAGMSDATAVRRYRSASGHQRMSFTSGSIIAVEDTRSVRGTSADLVVVCSDRDNYTDDIDEAARALVASSGGDIVYLRRETSNR